MHASDSGIEMGSIRIKILNSHSLLYISNLSPIPIPWFLRLQSSSFPVPFDWDWDLNFF